ncbi:MAG: hydantoinase B/oxoprolinase family protein [Maricaulaceae bacterium]|jgi:5-oxoprolinase (ATP-hydrolysing)
MTDRLDTDQSAAARAPEELSARPEGMWEFWIDRGGTFTDVIARDPSGAYQTIKLLSENPDAYDDAAVEAVRRAMGLSRDETPPGDKIAAVKMGTTVATNALLERRGAKTVFVATEGFADALIIGDQSRPDIFALDIVRPEPLYAEVLNAPERINASGDVLWPLDVDVAKAGLAAARARGCTAVAICLLHACQDPRHEQALARIAESLGFEQISVSHVCDPLVRYAPRARTTLADAYLTPVVRRYARQVVDALGGAPVYFMTSAGGLVKAEAFSGRDALLSGPAGGVVGMAKTASAAGFRKVVGFDMGGTSTDVSRFDGTGYERLESAEIAGWRVRAPMMAIHTVASGGGSILTFDGERARAGPESAGADPGPACYGLNGPLTVTDANVLLGRLDARFFPEIFGPDGDRPLNVEIVRKRFAKLAYDMGADSVEACAEGFLTVAVENMAQAVKRISIAKGYDASVYALSSFGGAGGQVACRVAEVLGIRTVLVHPYASVMSALGVGLSDLRVWREAALGARLDGAGADAALEAAQALERNARDSLVAQGADAGSIHSQGEARLRYAGSDTALPVPVGGAGEMRESFEAAHRRLFGFAEPGRDIVVESLGAEAEAEGPGAGAIAPPPIPNKAGPAPVQLGQLYEPGGFAPCPVYRLAEVGRKSVVHGPALIVEPNSQIVVDRGWRAERLSDGGLLLRRFGKIETEAENAEADPVRLELFNKRYMSVAEQMGVTLEKTAHSVNIKERLDFSCAVFDAEGGLVANAPHMPVHLGSMGASVRAVLDRFPSLKPGDAVALNNPYAGGTHLPDVTVVRPVFDPNSGAHLFYVAARGHHADIGGIDPGSMPPFSKTLEEEGALIDCLQILHDGEFDEAAVRAALAAGAYPARNPDNNIADLKAQLAACARGAEELQRLVSDHGRAVVEAYMGHVQANAEAAVRRVIDKLEDGRAEMLMDPLEEGGQGARIVVDIKVDRAARSAIIDFTGTSPQQESNFNAPSAVARAAVLYVFRCLVGDDIPLNEGCLKPLDIRIPQGSILDPKPPAAVVAGNVETSQIVCDALFAATGAMAAAQGTMNNFTFGDETRQYYETICGGAGATERYHGAHAVHTHMTNSRLTDPEILEARYPVLVETHGLRRGSGGDGETRGGMGSVRRIRFLDEMTVALVSGRRAVSPPGLFGGDDGAPGAQTLIRADGSREPLPARFRLTVEPGDAVEIETPGGGGFGES